MRLTKQQKQDEADIRQAHAFYELKIGAKIRELAELQKSKDQVLKRWMAFKEGGKVR
jgi:hypothetical protein